MPQEMKSAAGVWRSGGGRRYTRALKPAAWLANRWGLYQPRRFRCRVSFTVQSPPSWEPQWPSQSSLLRGIPFGLSGTPGRPWTRGRPCFRIIADAATPGVVYAGTGRGSTRAPTAAPTGPSPTRGSAHPPGSCAWPGPLRARHALRRGVRTSLPLQDDDGGATWNTSAIGLAGYAVLALALDPSSSSTLYASTQGFGVYKSTDGGAHWNPSRTGIETKSLSNLCIAPPYPPPSTPRP